MSPALSRRARVSAMVTLLACLWCLLALAPPILHAFEHHTSAVITRAALSPVCHQIASRSFAFGGRPMAVCARCAGVYLGFLAGCLFVTMALRPTAPPPGRNVLMLAGAPCALEWVIEKAGFWSGNMNVRAATGVIFGFVVAFYVIPAVDEMLADLAASIGRPASWRTGSHAKA